MTNSEIIILVGIGVMLLLTAGMGVLAALIDLKILK